MLDSAFELGEELDRRVVQFRLHRPLWKKYDLSSINLNLSNWTTIKYLNDDETGFHEDINIIPNDKGGLYMFSIYCSIIPGRTEFPVYIGRAQLTEDQNLRKRCREYYTKFLRNKERAKITKMFKYWANELYLSFMILEENEEIIDFEKKLINSLLLPFNDEIPDQEIRQAIKAFQL